ncbi:MAG: LPS export ABC transporter periplasmic protein LptC [Flavobacteriales bacterium]|jgi:LPS export ABC transporter protein LptC|nr:LPS export ABC transporter periplasmic protein LptC [Flavobacteriales bacterium]
MQLNNLNIFKSILVVMTGMLFSCSNSLEEVNEMVENNTNLGEISENVTLYFSDKGVTKIKLEAPILKKISVYSDEQEENINTNLICPKGMLVTFYDSVGTEESQLFSKYGKLLSEDQYLLVRDSVVFTNPKKEKLETELLHIFFNKDSITTDEVVKITTKDGIIMGEGLTSNTSFSKYQLHKITDSHYNFKDPEK